MKDLIKLQVEVTLTQKDMIALQKEVEQQREFQRKRGKPDWTEKDELRYGIEKRLRELRVRHGEEEYDAEFNGNFNKSLSITAEIRERAGGGQMACGGNVI